MNNIIIFICSLVTILISSYISYQFGILEGKKRLLNELNRKMLDDIKEMDAILAKKIEERERKEKGENQ